MKPQTFYPMVLLAICLALASLAFTAAPVFACGGTVLCVDKDAPGPSHDGSSWATAYTTLQDALAVATSGNEIWVAEGVYYPDRGGGQTAGNQAASFFLKSGVAIYGGFAGTETQRTQRDLPAHITVLSGDLAGNDTVDAHGVVLDWENVVGTDNTYQIVTGGYYGSGGDVTVDSTAVLDGFTITAGRDFREGAALQGIGAGLITYKSNPTLRHLVFSGNQATVGGGIYLWEGPAITMTDLTFTGNVATQGGGLYCRGIPLTLDQFLFQSNETRNLTAAGQMGGGMATTGSLTLTHGQFIGNTSESAGGLSTSGGSVSLSQVTFDGNRATGANTGAGGMVSEAGTPALTDVIFKNNSSNGWGGGYYHQNSDLSLTRVSFINNGTTGSYGGGIAAVNAHTVITDALFAGNAAAGGWGSGMLLQAQSMTMTNTVFQGNGSDALTLYYGATAALQNVTVAGNGGMGINLVNASILQVSNSIIYGNGGGMSGGGGVSVAYSIVGGGCPGGATCDHVIDADPLFVLPVVQGAVPTSTGDLRLRVTSPAIDAGDNSAVPAGLTTDLVGNPRLVDTPAVTDTGSGTPPIVDRGAYEYQGKPDLDVSKTNDVGGAVAANTPFNWMLTIRNTGGDKATFAANTVILQDDLPSANVSYGASASITTGATGLSGPITCTVSAYTLVCRANGGQVDLAAGGQFTVAVSVTTTGIPILVNPRSGGACRVDPNNVIPELLEDNNACNSDTVAVGQTSLTVAIHDAGHNSVVQAPVGATIHAAITATGVGTTPSGATHLYRYTNSTCSGSPTATTNQNLVNGTVESSGFAAASFYYRVLYSGDSTHEAVYSPCTQFIAYQAGPSFTVNTSDDDMVDNQCSDVHCTLREAILAANGAAGANTILFAIGSEKTITLTSAPPAISDTSGELTIDGQTYAVTVSGADLYRPFTVSSNARATLSNLTLVHGKYTGGDCDLRPCGGGLKVEAGANVTLTHSAIMNSTASGSGGGIYNAGALTIQQSTLAENSADEGGGILNGGKLQIQQSTLTKNTALYGGGILMVTGGTLTLENSTLSGNTATGSDSKGGGGAIDVYDGAVAIRNSTIAGNTAVSPNQAKSGLWLETGTLSLFNSIVASNNGANNLYRTGGTFTSQGYNLADAWNGLTSQSTDLTGDPKLGPLADYGGPTQTLRLLPGSPAIDAGSNDDCPTQDQRGKNRVGTCDIGAFEWQGYTLGQLTGASQSAVLNTAFAQPLGLTVTANDTGKPEAGIVIYFTAPMSGASIAEATPILLTSGADGTVSAAVTANGKAGSYNVTAGAAGATSVSFVLTNSLATATVTLSNLTQAYDGTPRPVSVSTTPSGLSVSVTYDGLAAAPTNAGHYAVVATVNSPEYQGTATGTLTITSRSITVTADVQSKVYGTPDPALTYQVTDGSLVEGDSLTGTLTRVAGEAAGTYAIQQGTLTAGDNYALSFVGANLTVNKADTSVALDLALSADLFRRDGTFTATVSALTPGGGIPTGTVTFKEGETVLGTATIDGSGKATLTIPPIARGPHTFTATYDGSTNHNASSQAKSVLVPYITVIPSVFKN